MFVTQLKTVEAAQSQPLEVMNIPKCWFYWRCSLNTSGFYRHLLDPRRPSTPLQRGGHLQRVCPNAWNAKTGKLRFCVSA